MRRVALTLAVVVALGVVANTALAASPHLGPVAATAVAHRWYRPYVYRAPVVVPAPVYAPPVYPYPAYPTIVYPRAPHVYRYHHYAAPHGGVSYFGPGFGISVGF